jgi:hypothetical protein
LLLEQLTGFVKRSYSPDYQRHAASFASNCLGDVRDIRPLGGASYIIINNGGIARLMPKH